MLTGAAVPDEIRAGKDAGRIARKLIETGKKPVHILFCTKLKRALHLSRTKLRRWELPVQPKAKKVRLSCCGNHASLSKAEQ